MTERNITLESVLEAAVHDLAQGRIKPHCFSAHVPGKGYVNDGGPGFDRADYLRQLARAAQAEVDNMDYAWNGYAEPGYEQPAKGVVMANWNVFPTGFDKVIEQLGYAVEWSDEWYICEDCYKAVRKEPDGYGWTPYYVWVEAGNALLCKPCWQEAYGQDEESEE